jgi:hypothetical protein
VPLTDRCRSPIHALRKQPYIIDITFLSVYQPDQRRQDVLISLQARPLSVETPQPCPLQRNAPSIDHTMNLGNPSPVQ